MKTILKYVIPIGSLQAPDVMIPADSRIVHVGPNTNASPTEVAFWVEVDTLSGAYESRSFAVVGTGMQMFGRVEYVGTVIDTKLGAAWHLYEMFPKDGE